MHIYKTINYSYDIVIREVERILTSMIKFASDFGIAVSKTVAKIQKYIENQTDFKTIITLCEH